MHTNYKPRWLLLILIILAISINLYFRLDTLFLPLFDRLAKKQVYQDIRDQLDTDMAILYPGIPDATRKQLGISLFKAYLRENKPGIKKTINQKSQEMKAYLQDERGWTYLIETDSYRWLRRVNTYLKTGHFASHIVNGQEYDSLEFASFGGDKIEPIKLHFYFGAYLYKILHSINNKLSLMNCLGLGPVILCPIIVLLIFYLCVMFGISYLESFLATLVLCLSPIVLSRTRFGWFDTDIYNIAMPLMITAILANAFRRNNSQVQKIIFLLLSGVLMGIYSSLWEKWWLFLYILFGGILLYKAVTFISSQRNTASFEIKKSLGDIFLFMVSAYLSVLAISGSVAIKNSFSEPLSYFFLRQKPVLDNFWPSVAFFVNELRRSTLKDMINFTGGHFIFFIGVAGVFFIPFHKEVFKDFAEKKFLLCLILLWLFTMLIMSYFGIRFILFLMIPLAISFCASLYMLRSLLIQKQNILWLVKNINKKFYRGFLNCIFSAAILVPISNTRNLGVLSMFNDSWMNMLTTIKESTPRNAIINADWSEGDWIMSIAERGTIQSSRYQYTAIPYWFYRALLSDNEEESFGIIRMIDSGGNKAFEELLKVLDNDRYACLELINQLVLLKKGEGEVLLSEHIRDKDTLNKVLKLVYGASPPAYLMLNNFMINSMPHLSKVGNWVFERFDLWEKFNRINKNSFIRYAEEKFGYSQKSAESIYQNLVFMDKKDILNFLSSSTYRFYTTYSRQAVSNEKIKTVLFDNGLAIDKDNLVSYYRDDVLGRWIIPGHLIFVNKDIVKEVINKNGDQNYSVLFFKDDTGYRATLFSRPLADSLFFKLYFLNGRGLKHFKLVAHESKKHYSNIYLYKME